MSDVQKIASDEKFCSSCGAIIKKEASICPKCGVAQQRLENVAVDAVNNVRSTSAKWVTLLLLTIFLGWLGIHRYYVKKYGTGFIWMISLGVSGIGWIIDIIWVLTGQFKDKKGNIITRKSK